MEIRDATTIIAREIQEFFNEWGFSNRLFLEGVSIDIEDDHRLRQYLCVMRMRHFNLFVSCRVESGFGLDRNRLHQIINSFKNGVAAYLRTPERFYNAGNALNKENEKIKTALGKPTIRVLRE